ncbi:pseudouridine synthase [Fusibacter tunisiensis]|uniref:Pseudouridine synthase n=1 Tax=Fusibacter tunisiensis TaxID=1008308 RepID=A0ABS2MPC2_9FIRM|nr:pseudouridine synthase [Fusibacter tunisiensis]MBM7561255.1 23S rRNA pseudouridine2604 synthase [Fusibacter tunisiensis]
MRLNNYISASGLCSRREADKFILEGRVFVNGVKAILGQDIKGSDRVLVDGQLVVPAQKHIYLILNKPVGITCTTERHIEGNIIDYIGHKDRIFPVGRLDKDSEGLIILTSDGSIVNAILREENNHDKRYVVSVNKPLQKDFTKRMGKGVRIFNPVKKEHVVTKPCKVRKLSEKTFEITLNQGLNRQIRRMCAALGYQVVKLKRTRIMHIQLEGLKEGAWRYLTQSELTELMKFVKNNRDKGNRHNGETRR